MSENPEVSTENLDEICSNLFKKWFEDLESRLNLSMHNFFERLMSGKGVDDFMIYLKIYLEKNEKTDRIIDYIEKNYQDIEIKTLRGMNSEAEDEREKDLNLCLEAFTEWNRDKKINSIDLDEFRSYLERSDNYTPLELVDINSFMENHFDEIMNILKRRELILTRILSRRKNVKEGL